MKSAFYITLASLFVLKILNFCLNFSIIQKNDLIRKIKLISKLMTLQPGKQTIAMLKKQRQSDMKFDELIQHSMRKCFLKNHIQIVVELFPDPFLKKQSWAYLSINGLKFYTPCFYCIQSWGLPKYIKNQLLSTCFYLI